MGSGSESTESEQDEEASVSVLATDEEKTVDSVDSLREQMKARWEEMKAQKEAAEREGETGDKSEDKPKEKPSRGRGHGQGNSERGGNSFRRPSSRGRWGRRKL